MPVELMIAPEAEFDNAEAYVWYEDRRAGLSEEFLPSVTPFVRVARGMKDGVDRDLLPRRLVKHGVWKAPYKGATVALVNDRVHLGRRRMLSRHASTEVKNSSLSPALRPSYQT